MHELELNMNEEFRAAIQYICHRITAQSIDSMMAEAFKSAALDEMSHILFFSDLITKHGGTPKFRNWDTDKSIDIKTMLEKDIELEKSARKRYSAQLKQMKDYPEILSIIQSVLSDEEEHEAIFTDYLEKMT